MTPSDLEAMVKNLNARTTRIEQILPTLATKDDLQAAVRDLATKDDLKVYATRDDLKIYATKDDLKAFATKADLKEGLASTLAESKQFTRALFEDLKGDIGLLAEHLAQVSQKIDDLRR